MLTAAMGIGAGAILLFGRDEEDAPSPSIAHNDPTDFDIPVPTLTRKQWLDFVKLHANGNPKTVTPSFRLGVFEMTVRRLCDLGAMKNPRVVRFRDRQVWDAEWCNPATLSAFQRDPLGQYALFAESIRRYAEEDAIKAAVGAEVDGVKLTLSGALAVAHRAGLPGLASWIAKPRDRSRFTNNTTSYFQRGNGLF